VITVASERFSAGWRLLPDQSFPYAPVAPSPDLVIDLIRPDDLVAFTVEGYDVELVGGQRPRIRPKADGTGRLVVRFATQHLFESALYETDPPPSHTPPVDALPARSSRLVFALAEDERVPFSSEGILEAIRRLPMLVHPMATPRPRRRGATAEGGFLHLPGGLIATVGPSGLVLSRAGRGIDVPDATTREGLARLSRDGRRLRALLATRTGTAVPGLDLQDDDRSLVELDETTVVATLTGSSFFHPDVEPRRRRPRLSRPTQPFETSIEAPFRLQISPSAEEGWHHASTPVAADDAPHRVEVWHSRLGVRTERSDGTVEVPDQPDPQRIIRALWARDREGPDLFIDQADVPFPDWQDLTWPLAEDDPFKSSLNGSDRHMLVRQSSESWLDEDGQIAPVPVEVTKLWLSALGAWLDLHGTWDTTRYTTAQIRPIEAWDHLAPQGRDQLVRVVYPGFLFPFGHSTTLVKITERKMLDAAPSVAGLFQRKFLAVGEPLRVYDQRDLPFTEIRIQPLMTPTLVPEPSESDAFVPYVGGAPFVWILHYLDKEGRPGRLAMPLVWVPAGIPDGKIGAAEGLFNGTDLSVVPANGQEIAYAEVRDGGDTVVATDRLRFAGSINTETRATSRPRLEQAHVNIPAVQQLSALQDPVPISYWDTYVADDFGGATNPGEVWAEVVATGARKLEFGTSGASSGSEKAGGFLQPNLELGGLSRIKGTVGKGLDQIAAGTFDPIAFLGDAAPQLFGLVPLTELLDLAGDALGDAPDIVSQQLDRIEGFLADLERAKKLVEDAVAEAQLLQQRAADKAAELQQQANAALAAAEQLRDDVVDAVDTIVQALEDLIGEGEAQVEAALSAPLQELRNVTTQIEQVAPQLPPLVRQQLLSLAGVLREVADAADLIQDLVRFVNQLTTGAIQYTFRYEWRPLLQSWPEPPPKAMLELPPRGLVLSVEGRAAADDMRLEVLAELKDFALQLFGEEPLVRFEFDHLSFHAGSSGKPDVDIVLQKIRFLGILGFVETLRELIPFDGFSDPPFLDVTSEGLSAGFTLGLPNVSIGVFTLSNISLGADVQVPFLGKAVTVGFNFCTRERPFTLAVAFIGGGGWFLLRLSPDGLDVLELGLEAGAILAVDFGVASGSISAMLGIYMRLEGDEGSLSGYFRLRGEVDVLGLISASIELYLELHYEFDTGKMIGSAKLTIKVEVFFFSTSVTISCERQFAGSKGDPSFADVMVLPNGTSPAWSDYCMAFAGES
jgi:hypothetical protein